MAGSGGDQFYYGTQDQGDVASEYNTRDYHIREVIEQSVRTGLYAQIVNGPYDVNGTAIAPGTVGPIGYVDVMPLVNQIDGQGNAMPHGAVKRLCYFRYGGANGAIISDPVVGDVGHMVLSDRDLSSVKATGKQANPGSRRKFDMSDGTYYPKVIDGAPIQGIAYTSTGVLYFDRNGNTITTSSSGIVIADGHGNVITTSSGGVTVKVGGGKIALTGGGTLYPVMTTNGPSSIAEADG
jgi:hypothetical protein